MRKEHIMLDSITTLKTDERALAQLRSAASRKPTADEIFEQQVSFVFGSIKSRDGVTREKVRQMLKNQEGVPEGQK